MKKIVVLVSNDDLELAYAEIKSNLDYDNIDYTSYVIDLDVKSEV